MMPAEHRPGPTIIRIAEVAENRLGAKRQAMGRKRPYTGCYSLLRESLATVFESLLPSCQNTMKTSDHFRKLLYSAICRGHILLVSILLKR